MALRRRMDSEVKWQGTRRQVCLSTANRLRTSDCVVLGDLGQKVNSMMECNASSRRCQRGVTPLLNCH
ncbi:hypothetical protein VTO42DRAFT_7423 [Malbranchea cinnamomea]